MVFRRRHNYGIDIFTPYVLNYIIIIFILHLNRFLCTLGKFLLEPILHDLHKFYLVQGDELKPQITLYGYDKGFDKDEQKTIILAKANMLIYMLGMIREPRYDTKICTTI